jgi:hypothetical protein
MMRRMPERADDEIEDFLRSLPPAPESWMARAREMPKLEQALAICDRGPGNCDVATLRRALEAVGLEPDDRRVRDLARLHKLRHAG